MIWRSLIKIPLCVLGVLGAGVVLSSLSGCRTHSYVKTFDYDNDGIVDKTLHVARHRVVREDVDRDYNGQADLFLYFNEQDEIYMKEYDTSGDGVVDLREEFFPNQVTRSSQDDDHDGLMDRAWVTHFDAQGNPSLMELDHNFDQKIDSKVDLIHDVREDLVHGQWFRSFPQGDHRKIQVNNQWLSIIFYDGEWIVDQKL